MPLPNFHTARVKDPADFETFRTKILPNGVEMVMAQVPDTEEWTVQSYRFPEVDWTPAKAKTWLDEHGVEGYDFEPAADPAEATLAKRAAVEAGEDAADPAELRELWKAVPPQVVEHPRAIFVAGAPNELEQIIGRPLPGLDGRTFKALYLDRLGLRRDEVSIYHLHPVAGSDYSALATIEEAVIKAPTAPIIALGKIAKEAFAAMTSMPHPNVVRRRGDRGEVERKCKRLRKCIGPLFGVQKADDEKRLVYGIVLEPHSQDLQGDVLDLDTIEAAAHDYLRESRTVGEQHSQVADAEVVESYLAPADLDLGGQIITRGTWIMVVYVRDEALWQAVKRGEFTGFSIGGYGKREAKKANVLFA